MCVTRVSIQAAAITFVLAIVVTSASAAPGDLLRTLSNPTSPPHGGFGCVVLGAGNSVLIGAYGDYNENGVRAGAAYRFDGTTGALLATFQAPEPKNDDEFGYSLATFAGSVLVGAPHKQGGGAVYLFGESGNLIKTYNNPTTGTGGFGSSVAMNSGRVVVTSDADPTPGLYFFDRDTGSLVQHAGGDARSLATVGDNFVVGCGGGPVPIYSGDGAPVRTLFSPNPEENELFGWSVASVGADILVGAPKPDDAGAAYLFDGATGSLLMSFQGHGGMFGHSVAAAGEAVVVGAVNAGGFPTTGKAYLFDGTTGALLATLDSPTGVHGGSFGCSVSALGSNVLVGAQWDTNGGAAYLFEGVPEPATLSLLALGGLALLHRRRSASS